MPSMVLMLVFMGFSFRPSAWLRADGQRRHHPEKIRGGIGKAGKKSPIP
jgi:hypothetical protein